MSLMWYDDNGNSGPVDDDHLNCIGSDNSSTSSFEECAFFAIVIKIGRFLCNEKKRSIE